jgi:hypothetical protein
MFSTFSRWPHAAILRMGNHDQLLLAVIDYPIGVFSRVNLDVHVLVLHGRKIVKKR